jgi:hypothetical protein
VETEQDFYAVTSDRSHRFDDLCADADHPLAGHHSALTGLLPATDPWQSMDYFHDMVGRFSRIGIDEFVLYWPQTWREAPREEAVFEEVAATVKPQMRASR